MKYTLGQQLRALSLALAVHAGVLALLWFGLLFAGGRVSAAGAPGPIRAALQVSGDDMTRARAAIAAAEARLHPQRAARLRATAAARAAAAAAAASEFARQAELSPDMVAVADLLEFAGDPAALATEVPAAPEASPQAGAATAGVELQSEQGRAAGSGSREGIGFDPQLEARYNAALQASARGAWDPGATPPGVHCEAALLRDEAGRLVELRFGACPFGPDARAAVERALRSTTLPYAGFERLFPRAAPDRVDFCHPQAACAR